jgi:hypothetical protein
MSSYLKGNRQLPAAETHIPPTSVVATGQIKIQYTNKSAILIALTFEEFLLKHNRSYRFTIKDNKRLPIIENLLTTAGFLTTLKKTGEDGETYLNTVLNKSSHPWFLSRELLTVYYFAASEQFELKK